MSEPYRPNIDFSDESARNVIGKRVPVCATHCTLGNVVALPEQFIGLVDRWSRRERLVLKLSEGNQRIIPPYLSRRVPAETREYDSKLLVKLLLTLTSPRCGRFSRRVTELARMFNWSPNVEACGPAYLR
jgi:hypothetical protein